MSFKTTNTILLNQSLSFLYSLFPDGLTDGNEFKIGSLQGERGESLSVNTKTGVWKDFATGEAGSDLISLYAAAKNISQGEALKELNENEGSGNITHACKSNINSTPSKLFSRNSRDIKKIFECEYIYNDKNNNPLLKVLRYKTDDGKKTFIQLHWENNKWIAGSLKNNRPLFNLPSVINANNILITEGEKACLAAGKLTSSYVSTTWAGGAQAITKTDFSPLYGKNILLWPDNDEAGFDAMKKIAAHIKQKSPETGIKILRVDKLKLPSKWDAADVGPNFKWMEFAKPIAEIYEPVPVASISHPPVVSTPAVGSIFVTAGVVTTDKGKPIANESNVLKMLNHIEISRDKIWYDSFHKQIFINDNGNVRAIDDNDYFNLLVHLQSDYDFSNCKKTHVIDAVDNYAMQSVRSEPADWIKSLKWDGVPRVELFFIDYMGAMESSYNYEVSRNFWVGLVARAVEPGCKMDNMVILEGKQGIGKSTALEAIGGKWYASAGGDMGNNDFFQKLHGRLIIEVAELDSFRKSEVNTIKKVLSEREDQFRAPYDRKPKTHKRQSIFVGTTNDDHYLKDPTGARRFWPVRCGDIKFDAIISDREQLFAEAYHHYKSGVKWHSFTEKSKKELSYIHEDRYDIDLWEDEISHYLIGKNEVTLRDIAVEALMFDDPSRFKKSDQMRMAAIVKKLGWSQVGRSSVGSQKSRLWKKSND